MSILFVILRWVISVALFLDGWLFLWTTVRFVHDVRVHPAEYAECNSRLSNGQVSSIFGGAGLLCWALLFITLPL